LTLYQRLGQLDRAFSIARSLAASDGSGYPRAYTWLARRLVEGRQPRPDDLRVAEILLARALKAAPKDSEALALMGNLYAATKRPAEAVKCLEPIANDHPALSLRLAGAYRELGRNAEATIRAERAAKAAGEKAAIRPSEPMHLLEWASAETFLGHYAEAIDVLKKGAAQSSDPVFARNIATVYAEWGKSLAAKGQNENKTRMQVVTEGLAYDPSNAGLLSEFVSLIAAGGRDGEAARTYAREMLTSGKAPEIAHVALGYDAWRAGKGREARTHWDQAYRLSPRTLIIGNNLAWTLAHVEPVDLPRALSLIDQILSQSGQDPRFRCTRGQILIKMGRLQDGVAEIEASLARGVNTQGVHASLADAYDRLGLPDIAAGHRKQALSRENVIPP
jgi:tetratricopeptide (TPR) repeat protein